VQAIWDEGIVMDLSESRKGRAQVFAKYVGHIAVMTGKSSEPLSIEGVKSISELLSKLDEKFPGFKEVFMPPGGVFNSRTAIICRRAGQPSFGIIDENQEIRDGDVLTFW
jgi:hypothetical protein